MLNLIDRVSAGDGSEFSPVMLELDPHKLYVCESKFFKKVVLKEFDLKEIKYNFKRHRKQKMKLLILDAENKEHTYIISESDQHRMFKYFKKHSVERYFQRIIEPKPLEEKKPEDMSEEELREHMFSSLGHVPVENPDGSIEYIGTYCYIDDNEHCLITGNGQTYHTYLNCFKNWTPEQQENFKMWKYTTVEHAESMGMKKCSFCDEKDKQPKETVEDFLDWLDENEDDYDDDDLD